MRDYSVLLEGVDAFDLSASVLRDLCDVVVEGSQRSARLMAEGRSVARGTAPAWVNTAADLRITGFKSGSLDLCVRADRLSDLVPELFAQQQLFPAGTDPDATAFDLFIDAADDAVAGRRDSERLDAGVLEVLARTNSLFARGGTRLSMSRTGKSSVVLDPQAAQLIRTLAEETPAARMSRVRGVLDMLTVSTRALVLRLSDDRLLRGFAGDVSLDQLKSLLGSEVVLEGQVAFRPSGDALRIEVDSVSPATIGDVIWAQLPRVEPGPRSRTAITGQGLESFFGKWPGDESDEELSRALKNLS